MYKRQPSALSCNTTRCPSSKINTACGYPGRIFTSALALSLIHIFLLGYPISEFKQNIDTTEAILNSLTAEDFKKWITRWFDEDQNWIYIMQGNNADYPFPTEEQISAVTRSARDWTFESGEEPEKLSGDGVLVDLSLIHIWLSWEETDQYDIGLDLSFLDYRLKMNLDYYYRYTTCLLYTSHVKSSFRRQKA